MGRRMVDWDLLHLSIPSSFSLNLVVRQGQGSGEKKLEWGEIHSRILSSGLQVEKITESNGCILLSLL